LTLKTANKVFVFAKKNYFWGNLLFNMYLRLLLTLFALNCFTISAQENYSTFLLPKELTENANAVMRLDQTEINILKRDKMVIKKKQVITILNEYGMRYFDAGESFSKSQSVNAIEAHIYDVGGKELKKFKKKDFKEQSLSRGAYVMDDKLLSLDYTPVAYPFTLVYTSEIETTNTAFIPQWSPVAGSLASTEKSTIKITYPQDLGFKYKGYNFNGPIPGETAGANTVSFTAESLPAMKIEDYQPALYKIKPFVLFGLEKFHLEGVDGEAQSWEAFGKWMYDVLLTGTDELTPETQEKIKTLTAGETDPLKKAQIVYEYVQSKTRYVLVALGIGGWKPMLAKDVDRLGYGDCKALTNYTRALLKAVGVDSYYTVIYGDSDSRDMREDFVSMQGNHIILAIPNNGKYVWLECTSQSLPFGFQGDFTDNRLALLVKPEGGQIVRTGVYEPKGNSQNTTGNYTVTETGAISAELHIASRGLQYDSRYTYETYSPADLDEMYKHRFSNINNVKLTKTKLVNDKAAQQLTEDIFMQAESYCSKSGGRLIFPVNAFNQFTSVPQRYRNRKMPFEISEGFYDVDEITIVLPAGFSIEARPENTTISDKFGEYKTEYELKEGRLIFRRSLLLNEGAYGSSEYENYRLFAEKISRNDNAKIVLVKN
jgi:transglutaminase-like putative cysteine protease